MTTFAKIIPIILRHEGGYVNDPADRGGETKYGISKRAFPNENIADLTKERAAILYHQHYWKPAQCDNLPAHIRAIHFDTAVNCGVVIAIRLLQRASGVRDDGVLGPITLAAAAKVSIQAYVKERLAYYQRIVDRDPSQARFLKGWTRRTNSFLP